MNLGPRLRPAVAILGPLEIRPGQIGSAVQRTIPSRLALHAGQPVTLDRIVDAVWEQDPPRTCAGGPPPRRVRPL